MLHLVHQNHSVVCSNTKSMRARSGINVADDGEDDVYDDVDVVHGSNGTLCNFFFALGGAGLLQG